MPDAGASLTLPRPNGRGIEPQGGSIALPQAGEGLIAIALRRGRGM